MNSTPRKCTSVRNPKTSPFFRQTGTPKNHEKEESRSVSCIQFPPLSAKSFGLIQELLAKSPFELLIAVTFLNRTKGSAALPVFWKVMERYSTPTDLASAELAQVIDMIQSLGLQRLRAAKIIGIATCFRDDPPVPGRRFRTLHYPNWDAGTDIKPGEILDEADAREGAWEIAYMPGIGAYAIDSWRIFCRDVFRGLATDHKGTGARDRYFEPEWKRVLPKDKELRAFLRWMWLKEGWVWDASTGGLTRPTKDLFQKIERGNAVWEELELAVNVNVNVKEDDRECSKGVPEINISAPVLVPRTPSTKETKAKAVEFSHKEKKCRFREGHQDQLAETLSIKNVEM